jgi:tRNA(Ile)-lysidine synthase
MKFTLDQFAAELGPLSSQQALLVALSGGMDSMLLLHCLVQLKNQNRLSVNLRAIHVNHGLQAEADRWQSHCEAHCKELQVELSCRRLELRASELLPVSENTARDARYKVF